MSLDTKSFGLSAAAATAIVYSICALVVSLSPSGAASVLSYVLHLDLSTMARPLSWASYFVGVIAFSITVGLVFALAAGFYNRFARGATAR